MPPPVDTASGSAVRFLKKDQKQFAMNMARMYEAIVFAAAATMVVFYAGAAVDFLIRRLMAESLFFQYLLGRRAFESEEGFSLSREDIRVFLKLRSINRHINLLRASAEAHERKAGACLEECLNRGTLGRLLLSFWHRYHEAMQQTDEQERSRLARKYNFEMFFAGYKFTTLSLVPKGENILPWCVDARLPWSVTRTP